MSIADEIRSELAKTEQQRISSYVPFDMDCVVENFFSRCVSELKQRGKIKEGILFKYVTAKIFVGHPVLASSSMSYEDALKSDFPSRTISAYCRQMYSGNNKEKHRREKALFADFKALIIKRCNKEKIKAQIELDREGDYYIYLTLKL